MPGPYKHKDDSLAYLTAKPGFKEELAEDGRLWVYLKGDNTDKPEKHISAIGAGPLGKTIKAKDRSTLNAYLRTSS